MNVSGQSRRRQTANQLGEALAGLQHPSAASGAEKKMRTWDQVSLSPLETSITQRPYMI